VQGGFQEGAAGVGGSDELSFEFVAELHKFVYFGDDAVLFGEGKK